jgi:hypothetical protein
MGLMGYRKDACELSLGHNLGTGATSTSEDLQLLGA